MTEAILLDTDVASFLLKRHARAATFRSLVEGRQLALSFVSVAELYKWAVKREWGRQSIRRLETTLREYVVIAYDNNLAWARLMATCESAGRSMPPSDAWIAATAMQYRLPLLTNNVRHFESAEKLCGLRRLRPE